MLEGMGESEEATPLVQLLSCAASAQASSVTKLEAAYQNAKSMQTERDAYKAQVDHYRSPAFERSADRFSAAAAPAPAAPSAKRARTTDSGGWTPVMPSGMRAVEKPRDGMQLRNPAFWKQLRGASGRVNAGMAHFSEPNLVGREYHADGRRRPTKFTGQKA